MPKIIPMMTSKALEALREAGLHAVGGAPGLFLKIVPPNSKYWVYRCTLPNGRRREMGLGGMFDVSLKDAREKALVLRASVRGRVCHTVCAQPSACGAVSAQHSNLMLPRLRLPMRSRTRLTLRTCAATCWKCVRASGRHGPISWTSHRSRMAATWCP